MRQETRQNFTGYPNRYFAAFEHPKTEKTRQETRQETRQIFGWTFAAYFAAYSDQNAANTRQMKRTKRGK